MPLPPVFLLGSSDYSAQVAAVNGFGFAFAAHINPMLATDALRTYRERFVPSPERAEPHAILAHHVIVAPSDEEARRIAAPARVAFRRLRAGMPAPLPTVEDALAEEAARDSTRPPSERGIVGAPETVRDRLDALLAETGADELMVVTNVHDHADRVRSYALLAEAYHLAPAGRPAQAA